MKEGVNMNKRSHEVIFCIVNAGFSGTAMEAARKSGATGGTVINARGTSTPAAESKFNISVQPEKEVVMIVVDREIKDAVLHALYKSVGLNTDGHGIAFAMPVDSVVGLPERMEPPKE